MGTKLREGMWTIDFQARNLNFSTKCRSIILAPDYFTIELIQSLYSQNFLRASYNYFLYQGN
jgi:hypothetical protein